MSEPSPTIRRLIDELDMIERNIARLMGEEPEDQTAIIALERRLEVVTAALAVAPCLGPADVQGKMQILCRRLLAMLHPRDPVEVLTLMMAAGVQADLPIMHSGVHTK